MPNKYVKHGLYTAVPAALLAAVVSDKKRVLRNVLLAGGITGALGALASYAKDRAHRSNKKPQPDNTKHQPTNSGVTINSDTTKIAEQDAIKTVEPSYTILYKPTDHKINPGKDTYLPQQLPSNDDTTAGSGATKNKTSTSTKKNNLIDHVVKSLAYADTTMSEVADNSPPNVDDRAAKLHELKSAIFIERFAKMWHPVSKLVDKSLSHAERIDRKLSTINDDRLAELRKAKNSRKLSDILMLNAAGGFAMPGNTHVAAATALNDLRAAAHSASKDEYQANRTSAGAGKLDAPRYESLISDLENDVDRLSKELGIEQKDLQTYRTIYDIALNFTADPTSVASSLVAPGLSSLSNGYNVASKMIKYGYPVLDLGLEVMEQPLLFPQYDVALYEKARAARQQFDIVNLKRAEKGMSPLGVDGFIHIYNKVSDRKFINYLTKRKLLEDTDVYGLYTK